MQEQTVAQRDNGPARSLAQEAGDLLFYFNGFNSAIPADWSDNEKIVAVADYARQQGLRFLPWTVDYRRARAAAAEVLQSIGRACADTPDQAPRRVIFSGSSMGGWYARIMQLLLARERPGLPVEALAFNPAFDLGLHGHRLLGPQLNFVTLEHYEWTERDSAELASLEASVDFDAPLPFFVYVDKGDEVIAWERSAARYAPIARFHAFEGGAHRFEHAPEALRDFDAAVRD